MVQMSIAAFTCEYFHSIDTCLFSSLTKNHQLKKPTFERRESFGIFICRILQLSVNDP